MKKLLFTTLLAAALTVPFGTVALADNQEASVPVMESADYRSGCVPAQTTLAEALSPAVHGVVLAMEHYGVSTFTPDESLVSYEALYNVLSMYGQLDERSEYSGDALVMPSEVVNDFASALLGHAVVPDDLPTELSDRIVYDATQDCYFLVCGNDSLSEIQFKNCTDLNGDADLYGSLVYLVDGTPLSSFRLVADYADNMMGFVITELELA